MIRCEAEVQDATTRAWRLRQGTGLRCTYEASYVVAGLNLCPRHARSEAFRVLRDEGRVGLVRSRSEPKTQREGVFAARGRP